MQALLLTWLLPLCDVVFPRERLWSLFPEELEMDRGSERVRSCACANGLTYGARLWWRVRLATDHPQALECTDTRESGRPGR